MGTSSQIGYLRDMIKCKLFFANNFERTGVWSAFCDCTFEEGPAIYCGRCTRSTQKCTYANWSMHRIERKYTKMHIRELGQQFCCISSPFTSRLYTIHHTPYTIHSPLAFRLSPITYTSATTSIANSLLSIAQSPKIIPCTICKT